MGHQHFIVCLLWTITQLVVHDYSSFTSNNPGWQNVLVSRLMDQIVFCVAWMEGPGEVKDNSASLPGGRDASWWLSMLITTAAARRFWQNCSIVEQSKWTENNKSEQLVFFCLAYWFCRVFLLVFFFFKRQTSFGTTAQLTNTDGSCRATDIFDETHIELVMIGSERSNEGLCCTAVASVAPSKVRRFRKEKKVFSHATPPRPPPPPPSSPPQWILLWSISTSSRWTEEHDALAGWRVSVGLGQPGLHSLSAALLTSRWCGSRRLCHLEE